VKIKREGEKRYRKWRARERKRSVLFLSLWGYNITTS